MTPVSRPYLLGGKKTHIFTYIRALFFWHAFCLTNGCLYIGSLEEVEINDAPAIISSDPPQNEPMLLSQNSNIAFVVVFDQNDPESLVFQWWVQGAGPLGTAEKIIGEDPNVQMSKITLPVEPSWNGRSLNVIVRDSYQDTAQISWQIMLVEEN